MLVALPYFVTKVLEIYSERRQTASKQDWGGPRSPKGHTEMVATHEKGQLKKGKINCCGPAGAGEAWLCLARPPVPSVTKPVGAFLCIAISPSQRWEHDPCPHRPQSLMWSWLLLLPNRLAVNTMERKTNLPAI